MVKKKSEVNYHVKDLVVVRNIDFDGNVKYEVGMITNIHYATQLTKKTYLSDELRGGVLTENKNMINAKIIFNLKFLSMIHFLI